MGWPSPPLAMVLLSLLASQAGGLMSTAAGRSASHRRTCAHTDLETPTASRCCARAGGGLNFLACMTLRGGGTVMGVGVPGSIMMADLARPSSQALGMGPVGRLARERMDSNMNVSGILSDLFDARVHKRHGHGLGHEGGPRSRSRSRSSSPALLNNPKGIMGRSLSEGRGKEIYLPGVLRDDGSVPRSGSEPSRSCSPPAQKQPRLSEVPKLRPLPPGRDPAYFNPSPYSAWANNAITISFVRGVEDLCDPFRQAHPLFTHQVFGPQEEIVGYNQPSVHIIYSANTLRPTIAFKHMGAVEQAQLTAAKVLGATPVDFVVKQRLPCDYAATVQDVLKEASNSRFVPLGSEFASYEAPSCGPGFKPGAGGTAEAKQSRFKLYRAELRDRKSTKFVKRLQTLCVWHIERASYIKPDGNWELITLYEAYEKDGKEMYQLVGFVTTYRDYTGKNMFSEKEKKDVPTYKLRLSQYVILPIFQRCGHGGKMLTHIYEMARKTEDIVEVTVEEPHSDMFIEMRDRTDSQIVLEMDLLDSLTEESPPYEALRRQLKWSRSQLRRLAQSVIKKVVREPSPGGALCTVGGVEYFAEDFVLVRGLGEMPYVAHVMGLNPSTQMLRVRWVYRYDEVPPAALRMVPRATAAYYKRRNPCTSLEMLYTFHEGFVSPQTLMGKCAVLLSTHEPVDPVSQLGGLSAFFCRFVYDPAHARVWSFLETKIKPKFRRILDETLSRNEYPFPVFSGDQVVAKASSQHGSSFSSSSATELDDDSLKRESTMAERTEPAAGDASSIAYSDTNPLAGYSKRGVGLEDLAFQQPARSSSAGDSCESTAVCKRSAYGGTESVVCVRRRKAKARNKYGTPSSSCVKITGTSETLKEELRDTMLLAPRALCVAFNGEVQPLRHNDTAGNHTRTGGKSLGGVHFFLRGVGGCRLNFNILTAELSAASKKLGEQIQVLQGGANANRETAGAGREGGMVLECLFAQMSRRCIRQLETIMADPEAVPFLLPVDPKRSHCKDYDTVISLPMDLGTVMGKLRRGTYRSAWGLVSDVLLTFSNAMTYNPPDHPVHKAAARLSSVFKQSTMTMLVELNGVLSETLRDPWHLACAQIMRGLLMRPGAWPFLAPVDPDALGIPDYTALIKQPMDLGTAARKLQEGRYGSAKEMVADVHLTLDNAMKFNPPGHQVHKLAKRLREVFEEQWDAVQEALARATAVAAGTRAKSASDSPAKMELG